jgi:hypothetical protein
VLESHTVRRCTMAGLALAAMLCSSSVIRAQNDRHNGDQDRYSRDQYGYNHDPYADRYRNGRYDAYSPVAEIEPGTFITVRTNTPIDTDRREGAVYPATVQEDVWDNYQRLAVPMIRRGSPAELVARQAPDGDLVLDLNSVTVEGRRYTVSSSTQRVEGTTGRRDEGNSNRTPEYIGGGAILGTIVGALTGGGKGAAIGAAGGAAAGAGAAYITKGHEVRVPAGAVMTFRLNQPLTVGVSTRRPERDRDDRDYRDRR